MSKDLREKVAECSDYTNYKSGKEFVCFDVDGLDELISMLLNEVEKIVADKYDEHEPWLEPGEITKILRGSDE